MKAKIFQYQRLLAILIIVVTVGIAIFIVQSRPAVEVQAAVEHLQEVNVVQLEPQSITIPLLTQGIVEPRTKIKVLSEVNGRVIEASSKWVNGGFFRKGDVLLSVEDYYYQNQLARAKANLAQAKSGLEQEQGFSYVAKQDWEKRNPDADNSAAKPLALREPQLAAIKAQYEAANADVLSAEKLLGKTKISTPFDGVVVNKVVDAGQYVSPGLGLADLFAIDVVEIRVPLTESQQAYLNLPDLNHTSNIPAIVKYHTQNDLQQWKGHFVRTEGVLDPVTKVLNGVVQVEDPYGLNKPVKTPLRLGSFVEVELQGKKIDNIFVIPRRLFYTGNIIWLVDKENKLRSRVVKVLPIRDENVYIYEGVSAGDKMIADGVFGLLDGKLVKPVLVSQKTEKKAGHK